MSDHPTAEPEDARLEIADDGVESNPEGGTSKDGGPGPVGEAASQPGGDGKCSLVPWDA
jgi:hypothetical protein